MNQKRSSRGLPQSWRLVVGCGVLLVVAITAGALAFAGISGGKAQATGPSLATGAAVTVAWPIEAWLVPDATTAAGEMTDDGTIFANVTTPSGACVTTTVGRGIDAQVVNIDGPPVLLVRAYDGSCRLEWFDSTTSAWNTAADVAWGDLVHTALAAGGKAFYQPPLVAEAGATEGPSLNEVSLPLTSSGAALTSTTPAQLALPATRPDPHGALPAGLKAMPVPSTAQVGSVRAMVPVGSHLVVFDSMITGASVSDLTAGTTTQLAGFGNVFAGAAARGGDGLLHVVAWLPAQQDSTVKVLSIDPNSLAVVATRDTGLGGLEDNICVVPSASGAVVMIVGYNRDGPQMPVHVLVDDTSGLREVAPLPTGLANHMTQGVGNTVLLYGGPAGNAVSSLDLATGALVRDLSSLRAPAGSTVLALRQ